MLRPGLRIKVFFFFTTGSNPGVSKLFFFTVMLTVEVMPTPSVYFDFLILPLGLHICQACLGAKLRSTWVRTSMSSASHGSFEGDAASLKRRLTIGTDTGQLARLVSEAQAVAKQSQVQHAGAPVGRKHTRKYASALLPAA